MKGFFNDIAHDKEFEGVEFEVKGTELIVNKKVAGYLVPLSNSLVLKSVVMDNVYLIGYDEFVVDKGHLRYLQDEVVKFLELYETVARMREGVRCIFMSNAVSVVNPYFLFWDIRVDNSKRFWSFADGDILVEFVQNQAFIEAKYKTRFGKLIKGTKYGDYAIENKFLNDNDNFIGKKNGSAVFKCSVDYNGNTYGFWIDYKEGKFIVSNDLDPYNKHKYVITDKDHNENAMLLKNVKNAFWLQRFIEAYEGGFCYFESLPIKNQAIEIFRTLKR